MTQWVRGISLVKDPAAVLNYEIDWTDWLSDGETVTTPYAVVSSGLVLVSSAVNPTNTGVIARVSGGVVGQSYTVTLGITTNLGQVDRRSFGVNIQTL